ncbi:MAG: NAD(+) diphosphatase [Roseiarcus sp.]
MQNGFFQAAGRGFDFAYRGVALDRLAELRDDAAAVRGLRSRAEARFALIGRDMPILARSEPRRWLFPRTDLEALGGPRAEALLGLDAAGAPLFAARLHDEAVEMRSDQSDGFLDRRQLVIPGRDDLELVDLRSITLQGLVEPHAIATLGLAKAILDWHARHGFCARCGSPSRSVAAGWRRECEACKSQHFPRTDPVVIMLAHDGERCLMGRQRRFPKGMYSALAGFIEPGETVEEAARREIREEAGIDCDEVHYIASQPWPFPSSLMIGCLARARNMALRIDDKELEDARWFDRDEVEAMQQKRHPTGLTVPHRMAIAHHLISFWLEERS